MLAFLALAVVIARVAFGDSFPAIANLITGASLAAALISVCVWTAAFSRLPRARRYLPLTALGVLAGAFFGLFRVDEVDGDMVPRLAFRWSANRDALLKSLEPGAESGVMLTPGPNDYPRFLGPAGDLRPAEPIDLATNWDARPPEVVWKIPIGAGWSQFSVVGDFAFTMEQRGDEELVVCRRLADGETVWVDRHSGRFVSVLGGDGPRATPTVHDGRVYTLGASGRLACLDGTTGEAIWEHDLVADFEAVVPEWGMSASPLIVDELAVVPLGAPGASLAAFRIENGELAWSCAEEMSAYASPELRNVGGVPQILYVAETEVFGVTPESGEVLWSFDWPGQSDGAANNSQPIVIGDDRILVSKGYMTGAKLMQVSKSDEGAWTTSKLWTSRYLKTKFTNAVVIGDFAYGLDEGVLCCVSLADGSKQWKNGRYGHGQILLVGEVLLVQCEDGDLAAVDASPEGFRELARTPALEGKSWANLALAGDLLLLRNSQEAACLRLPTRSPPDEQESAADAEESAAEPEPAA